MIRAALKHVARTHNMSALARDTGLNRGNLYEALSEDGNPTLATLLKVANTLGLRLRLEAGDSPLQGAQLSERQNLPAGSPWAPSRLVTASLVRESDSLVESVVARW